LEERDQPLTALGHLQAARLGEMIAAGAMVAPDVIYSSLLIRAVETTAGLSRHCAAPIRGHLDLHEVGGPSRGHHARATRTSHAGQSRTSLQTLCPGIELPAQVDETGWYQLGYVESWRQAWQRAQRVTNWLAERYLDTDKVIAIVAHQLFLQVMVQVLIDHQPDFDANWYPGIFKFNNTGTALAAQPSQWGDPIWFEWINRVDHLTPDQVSY
jgi:broad specificity phosphatase PhoE